MQPKDAQATSPTETQPADAPPGAISSGSLPVWEHRESTIDPRDFTTAMVHLYRAEITRANAWRGRLDVTTNWALITTGAAFSFAFASADAHHSVVLLTILLVTVLLFIEARRYRYYELWAYRIRLMETNFFSPLLLAPVQTSGDWMNKLAHSLNEPSFSISNWQAVGQRLRQNYIWIYLVLEIAWIAKLLLYPQDQPLTGIDEVIRRGHLGVVPGEIVIGAIMLFDLAILLIAVLTARSHAAIHTTGR